MNFIIAYLIPSSLAGIILKVHKRRRVYKKGSEGARQLARDGNSSLIGINALFLLWTVGSSWQVIVTKELVFRTAAALFAVTLYYNQPNSLVALPDTAFIMLRWLANVADAALEHVPRYNSLRTSFAARTAMDPKHHAFSGPQIGTMQRQLLLNEVYFTCEACGLVKENTRLGEALSDESGKRLFFCDETSCRLEASNLYAKSLTRWRKGAI